MVNVTKANFLEQLRDLLVHLPTASFVSIDEEMTGISLPGSRNSRPNKVELPSERYTNLLKEVPERYAILQVGVAVFHKNPKYKDPAKDSGGGAGGGGSPSRARASSTTAEEEQRLLLEANGGDSDAMEHAFMHREGALNQDELEDLTEREEDNEAEDFMAFAGAAASGSLSMRREGDTDAQAAARAAMTAGIRIFEEEPQPEYTSRIYNFYIFPNAWSERELTLNPSTIKFLLENNMDFNKVFEEGVPFTTVKHAEALKERYFRKHNNEAKKNGDSTPKKKERVKLTSTHDISFVARVMANLREWIDSDDSNLHNLANGQGEGTSLVLPPCNAFLRRCLYETIEAEYSGLLLERADLGPNAGPTARNQIRVIRLSPEERHRRENRLKVEEWEKLLLGNLGFTTVFQAISDVCNGKVLTRERIEGFLGGSYPSPAMPSDSGANGRHIPLIVHNGLMDLMFLLTHFHDPSLPTSFEETKMQIRNYFPSVFDTKVMAKEYSDAQIKGGNTALGDLFDTLQHVDLGEQSLFPTISNQENGGSTKGQAHEAAYDAYMTGSVFSALGKRILEGKNVMNFDLSFNSLLRESSDSLLREYLGMNMLYMHVSLYTIDLESSSGPAGLHDPLSCGLSIDTTFHVSGITTSVSTRDILQALMAGSEGEGDDILRELKYDIIWINDASFFVGTRFEEGVALDDRSTLKLIAMHVRNKLHGGLGNVDIVSLEHYFKKKNVAKDANTGGFAKSIVSLATAPFQLLKRAMSTTSEQEPTNKRRRLG